MIRNGFKRFMHSKILPISNTVDLSFSKISPGNLVIPNEYTSKPAIVNIHGILGSKMMFCSLSRELANVLQTDVYSLDLRNHGTSPRAGPFDYLTMTRDIIYFIKKHIGNKRPINILGFSAGGKLGLLTTLSKEINVRKCISIDLPPYYTPEMDPILVDNYNLIMEILNEDIKIQKGSKNWKVKVQKLFNKLPVNIASNGGPAFYFSSGFLSLKGNDLELRDSLPHRKNPDISKYIEYYIPLQSMPDFIEELKKWPDLNSSRMEMEKLDSKTNKPVLFLKGKKSFFINENYDLLKNSFPNAQVHEFDSGHNIMFEKPRESTETIINFFQ
ncbi:hypothetical protein Kpol_1062p36 [Vanderwaltozyma polyspora DSM 70294]|uniref:AB hydrolase-1 domain-containing protein n=1 Tax=Vanderwaltozyma polyspora (strain ATCC 22028 / DSM 70294 / BCRC 21397 / CBS 2163 / NBRC 10782 / NRRL Y-8283 / UCD 57-17) TaxID=436907 RepID=A7TK92_VANPO|nr:uncharacterized protein Kpol_1062p36 [Vanderwaltozyma polyspora DSM 70294]EDO17327.1 hypothetical protein Kpol_1062p36 [Vanderwaltozyma polyspora DSM 70294]